MKYVVDKENFTITVDFDPRNPGKSHKSLDAAIDSYTSSPDWTTEELEAAKKLSRELLCKLFDESVDVLFLRSGDDVIAHIQRPMGSCASVEIPGVEPLYALKQNLVKATPIGNDVFNATIGKCVCLCRATETPVPKFIKNKNK